MTKDEKYMQHCIHLAMKGLGNVAPNPMVGAVVVHKDEIIGEGYHQRFGEAHAEVNAINAVVNKELLKQSTLYVNLEPCSHYGKTPPCADLIIHHQIPNVVIGSVDFNSMVNGKGIEKLVKAGINVKVGVLEGECKELNKRFFTFHQKKRPYIILKWAQTVDGYIDYKRTTADLEKPLQISSEASKKLVHAWRAQEQAIMVGTTTVLLDNPKLTVREAVGANPLRVTIDRHLKIAHHFNLFDRTVPTLVFTAVDRASESNLEFVKINFDNPIIEQILTVLYNRSIQSLIVEGGGQLLQSFIDEGLWDEARVFIATKKINDGVNAPQIGESMVTEAQSGDDRLLMFVNQN